jgi:hypothetical protein
MTRHHSKNLELTNAAAELLDKHLASTRARVLREVVRARVQRFSGSQVRADEVSSAIQRLLISDARVHYWSQLRRALELTIPVVFAALALLLPVITATVVVLEIIGEQGPSSGLPSLALGTASGILATLVAASLRRVLLARRRTSYFATQEFIRSMVQVEADARRFTEMVSNSEVAAGGLTGIFRALLDSKVWSEADTQSFRVLLRLRNALVHEQVTSVPAGQLSSAMIEVQRLRQLVRSGIRSYRLGSSHRLGSARLPS